LEFLQSWKAATAGSNTIAIQLFAGTKVKIVNTLNQTTAWLRSSIELANRETGGLALTLKHYEIQRGLKDVHWNGEVTIEEPLLWVRGQWSNCVLNDKLFLTVGFE